MDNLPSNGIEKEDRLIKSEILLAKTKAQNDWRDQSCSDNNYAKGSIQYLAYQAEFLKASKMFGENGGEYES